MFLLPNCKQLTTANELQAYATAYQQCSGLAVPLAYLQSASNHVFGIYLRQQLIGGFVLGNGPQYRTIELFANEHEHKLLYQQQNEAGPATEICCFWIARNYRRHTRINYFCWASMSLLLWRFGQTELLFGTCSRSLARLYATTEKSVLVHTDRVNQKATFIFRAKQRHALKGIFEIICHKMKRQWKMGPGPKWRLSN